MSVERTPRETVTLAPVARVTTGVAPSFDVTQSVTDTAAVWSRLAEGRAKLQAGDLREAEEIARSVLQSMTSTAEAPAPSDEILAVHATGLALLGVVLDERGEPERARTALEQAVERFDRGGSRTGRGVVSYAEGLALVRLGRPEAAEVALRRAFREGEDTPDQRRALAVALRDQGRTREAYEHLRTAVDRSVDWRAWRILAELADDLDEAVTVRAQHWADAARVLAASGRYDEALDALVRSNQLSSTPDTRLELAVAQTRSGLIADALETLVALESDTGGTAQSAILRAEVLDGLGRPSEAVEAADRALLAAPDDVTVMERRATVLAGTGTYDRLLEAA
jgi:tetratricopeptide (TPR) repeat protein